MSLENQDYVHCVKAQWGVLPTRMTVVEYCGKGDQFFGGSVDDRPLGKDGNIVAPTSNVESADFVTIEDAHEAAKNVANRRSSSVLGVIPYWN